MLVVLTSSSPVALLADGSAAANRGWDRAALLRGYSNPCEIPAKAVACPELPADLVGTYFRNGHARFRGYDGKKVRHPFDADGMVSAITLDGSKGTAVVRQRFVASEGAVAERAAQKTIFPGQFGNPLPFWSGGSTFKNLANTNVLSHAGKLLALWEGSRPHVLDPLSLATVGEWTIDGLVGNGPTDGFSAHPRRSPDGSLANFAYFGNPASGTTTVRFWDFQPGSFDLKSPAQTHEVDGFGLYHDFLATDNWFAITAAPATWGPARKPLDALKGTLEWIAGKRAVTSMIEFDESSPTVLHLFPRNPDSGRVPLAIELDTFFSFHHANAYEDEASGTLTFDTVTTPKLKVDDSSLVSTDRAAEALRGGGNRFIVEDLDYETDVPRTDLVRYVVNLRTKTYHKTPLSTRHVEFPSVNPAVSGEAHRYVYSTPGPSAVGVSPQAGVLKTDTLDASQSQIWLPEHAHEYCGEVIFTPRRAAGGGGSAGGDESPAEDDGYLLTLCFDGKAGTSSLLVIDAQRVGEGPIARVPLSEPDAAKLPPDADIRGPGHGLHATWVADAAPTLREVQAAEERRGQMNARFLSDAPRF